MTRSSDPSGNRPARRSDLRLRHWHQAVARKVSAFDRDVPVEQEPVHRSHCGWILTPGYVLLGRPIGLWRASASLEQLTDVLKACIVRRQEEPHACWAWRLSPKVAVEYLNRSHGA